MSDHRAVTATLAGPGAAGPGPACARLRELATRLDVTCDADGLGINTLRAHSLMSYLVPAELGGSAGTEPGMLEIAERLGGACPGLAITWVMHCQMVAIVDQYAPEPLRSEILRDLAARQQLLASVTTEPGKGGHLLTALTTASSAGGQIRFTRPAPVVSAGRHADAFLVTLRRSAVSAPDDVVLAYFRRDQAECAVDRQLDMLGMRAAGNVAMTLTAEVPVAQIIDPPGGFARIATRTMAPLGHLGWAAAWVGAAREALRIVIGQLRSSGSDSRIRRTDQALYRAARARCDLDLAEAIVIGALREYTARAPGGDVDTPAFQVLINNVKLAVSERAFSAVNELVDVAGMHVGYSRESGAGPALELILRDLRSASLMYANDRLIQANGRLALLDRAACSFRESGFRNAG